MAHEIMGNRVMVRDVPAWHAIGDVVSDLGSASNALKHIHGDDPIIIDKLPYGVQVPGYGMWMPDDRYVLVRRPTADDPTPRNFGEVGPQYTLLQNEQIATLVDMLIDGSGGKWTMDTIGILRNGETIFFTLKDKDGFEIAGDDHKMYFALTDQRNGGMAIDMMATIIRIVCANTVRFALADNKARITIRHHSDLFKEVEWRMNIIAAAIKQGESMVKAMQKLPKIDISLDMLNKMLDELFPVPSAPATLELLSSGDPALVKRAQTAQYQYLNRIERNNRARQEIADNFVYLADGGYGYNGYSAMNALTGWIDHQSGKDTENGLRVMAERTMTAKMDDLRTTFHGMLVNRKKYGK